MPVLVVRLPLESHFLAQSVSRNWLPTLAPPYPSSVAATRPASPLRPDTAIPGLSPVPD